MKKSIQTISKRPRAQTMLAMAVTATTLGIASPAIALVINPTFDTSFSGLSNASQVEGAITYATDQFEAAYTNPITVNITFEAENTTSFAGETLPNYVFTSYSSLRTAFVADAASTKDSDQMTAAADNWPATDPTGKASDWYVPSAEGKALGVIAANSPGVDATIEFGFSSTVTYAYDPFNRAASGTVDFIGVAEHEIAHGMGRVALLGLRDTNNATSYTPLDLYRFKSPGTLGLTSTNSVYYSINKGVTNLKSFASSSDTSDWNGSATGSYVPDSFNAVGDGNMANTLTPVDITEMDGLGFNPGPATLTWNGGTADFLQGNAWSNTNEANVNPFYGVSLVVTSGSPFHNFTTGESFDLSNTNSDMGDSLTVTAGAVTIGGNINVGGSGGGANGTGVLTVSGSGILTVGGTLTAFNSGSTSVNLSGGTINTAALNLSGDASLLNWTSGTLNFTNGLTVGSGGPLGSNVTLISGQTLGVTNAGTLSISGTLNVNGGAINAGAVNLSGSYLQTSGTATLGQTTGSGGISITGGKTTLSPGAGMSQIGSLTMALTGTGMLDITNNTLAINFPSPTTDPAAMIRLYLQTGYNNDTWTGPGIVSSNAAANSGLYAVGYADGNLDSGTPAGTNQILIENTLAGDANLDGKVNFADLLVVAQNFNHILDTHGNPIDWADGDFNYDGKVNFADLLLVAQNFNKQLSAGQLEQLPGSLDAAWNLALADVQASDSNNVPEPASCSLMVLAAMGLLARRVRGARINSGRE